MFSVFSTALLGLVLGFLGRGIMPASDKGGVITTICVGICGANMTASIGWLMDFWPQGSIVSYAAATAGAIVLLLVYRAFAGMKIEA